MNDKITLDRETFKALAADTRVDMLKLIHKHKLTLTDLSGKMDMSPSTIKEHLDKLVEVGLIEVEDRGTKWKYYRLTSKGENIVSPTGTTVWILLATSIILFGAGMLSFTMNFGGQIIPAYGFNSAMSKSIQSSEKTHSYDVAGGLALNDSPRPLQNGTHVAEKTILRQEQSAATDVMTAKPPLTVNGSKDFNLAEKTASGTPEHVVESAKGTANVEYRTSDVAPTTTTALKQISTNGEYDKEDIAATTTTLKQMRAPAKVNVASAGPSIVFHALVLIVSFCGILFCLAKIIRHKTNRFK